MRDPSGHVVHYNPGEPPEWDEESDQLQQHGVGGVDEPVVLTQAQIIHDFGLEIARLRARCASLEAVVEAAKGIALRQSRTHQALRQALAAHATTTQEGNHG